MIEHKKISIDQLAAEVDKILTVYHDDVINGIKKEAKKSMTKLVKDTKATAPVGKRKKHYRDSITSRKDSESAREVNYIWYVKGVEYRLSHLLEYGHATRNGGRTKAFHFIRNAYEPIEEEYLNKVKEIIQNG